MEQAMVLTRKGMGDGNDSDDGSDDQTMDQTILMVEVVGCLEI